MSFDFLSSNPSTIPKINARTKDIPHPIMPCTKSFPKANPVKKLVAPKNKYLHATFHLQYLQRSLQ